MGATPQFTRKTIIAAGRTVDSWGHGDIDAFLLEHSLEAEAPLNVGSRQTRATNLIRYLLENGEVTTDDGENLVGAVVRDLIQRAARRRVPSWGTEPDFAERFPELARALTVDGFVVKDGQLRLAMPAALGLPVVDDEVHELLKQFGFVTSMGHLDQALQNHGNGLWAAANGQIRSFVMGLIDEIAEKLAPPSTVLPPPGGGRLNWLATIHPPFVVPGLNEWDGQGKGFLEALLRRLHPQGPHPGLSDEEDSTFRLHIAFIVGRMLLRRFDGLMT